MHFTILHLEAGALPGSAAADGVERQVILRALVIDERARGRVVVI